MRATCSSATVRSSRASAASCPVAGSARQPFWRSAPEQCRSPLWLRRRPFLSQNLAEPLIEPATVSEDVAAAQPALPVAGPLEGTDAGDVLGEDHRHHL